MGTHPILNKMDTGFWAELFAWLFGQKEEDIKDTEEFRCEYCNRRISEEKYYESVLLLLLKVA